MLEAVRTVRDLTAEMQANYRQRLLQYQLMQE